MAVSPLTVWGSAEGKAILRSGGAGNRHPLPHSGRIVVPIAGLTDLSLGGSFPQVAADRAGQ